MFSGIIDQLGTVESCASDDRGGVRLVVASPAFAGGKVMPKDSVSINGVCLTAAACIEGRVNFDVVPETLARATLGALRAGDRVNVELSLRVGDRIGGHFVYAHVDTPVSILSKVPEGQGFRLSIETPRNYERYLIEKGYVAIDGVSLTIAAVRKGFFEIALIPETAARTTLGTKTAGDRVNLEIDPIARYALGVADMYTAEPGPSADELAWAYEI